jgi:hypothetical protein
MNLNKAAIKAGSATNLHSQNLRQSKKIDKN